MGRPEITAVPTQVETIMEQVLTMGWEEGLTQAVGQIDAILAEDAVRSA